MASTKVSSTRNELFFLKFDVDDIEGPSLPTNGDVLRYYFYLRAIQSKDEPRTVARVVVDKCIKIWTDNGIPTTQGNNGIKYLMKMLSKFNTMRDKYDEFSMTCRKQTLAVWEEKFQVIFFIGTKNAVDKCSAESRKMLLAAKEKVKEFRKATNNDKWLVDIEKQEKMLKTCSKSSDQSKVKNVRDDAKKLVDKREPKDISDKTKRLADRRKVKDVGDDRKKLILRRKSKDVSDDTKKMVLRRKSKDVSDDTKKLVDQPKFKYVKDDMKKLVDQPIAKDVRDGAKNIVGRDKRKRGENRPGPKSSKKRKIESASNKELKTAPVSSVSSNSDIQDNNEAAELRTTVQTESNSIQRELDSEKQFKNSAVVPSGLDINPEEEDVIPPMVQKTIIKEEIDMDWDQSDNWSTSLLFHEDFFKDDKENNNPFEQLVNFSHMAYQL